MRVLLTTDTVGGVWTFTRELTSELLHRGHSVALLSFGPRPNEHQNAWVVATGLYHKDQFFFRSRPVPLEWEQGNDRTWDEGKRAFMGVLQDCPFEIDLIHASQFCWGGLDLPFPLAVTAHSDVLSWAEACRPNGLAVDAWLSIYKELVEAGLQAADHITAPTAWMADTLARLYGLEAQSITVIPNGRALVLPETPPQRYLQAITAGRFWDEAKGLFTLDDLASPMPLLIAGDMTRAGEPAAHPQLPASARPLGSLSEARLLSAFQQSSIYVAASLYEPFGLAPLEAALCGCAVVARDLPSFCEVWDDAALYFSDTGELQAHLNHLTNNPEALLAARQRSLRRAQRFTTARMTDSYLELYAGAIQAGDALDQQRPLLDLPRPHPEPWNAV